MARYQDHAADCYQRNGGKRYFLTPVMAVAVLALLTLLPFPCGAGARERPFLAYHASWYEHATDDASQTTLARLPAYMNIVALVFARPDMVYKGDLDISRTGLQYNFSGTVLRDAIALLKKRNPGTRVIISVGGANWTRWDRFDEHALARLVRDLGADGVDLDYEPTAPACFILPKGNVSCSSDVVWVDLVERTRAQLPRPYLLTLPAWSVGAYGENEFVGDGPSSPWRGSMLHLLRSDAAEKIDLISIMAYDAGPHYDARRAFEAYRAVWKGPLLMGIPVMPLISDGTMSTLETLKRKLAPALGDDKGGVMLYVLLDCPPEANCQPHVNYKQAAKNICETIKADRCDTPVP